MPLMSIRILINGAQGKMGQVTVQAIQQAPDLELVATLDRGHSLITRIDETHPDVAIDFTEPKAVYKNAQIMIEMGVHPVIGTSGLTLQEIENLQHLCREKSLGGIIAPNFSLGAVLMMKYAEDAARYFKDVEIIEMHHHEKKDAPSGTANKTAQMIKQAGHHAQYPPIHSVRLPGLVAHQRVILGGLGETLTIQHDSINRDCFMPGVLLACRKVMTLKGLFYGLEKLLTDETTAA